MLSHSDSSKSLKNRIRKDYDSAIIYESLGQIYVVKNIDNLHV